MASFTDTVKIIVDVVTDKASSGLKTLKSDVTQAETGMGKFKAAAGGAGDFLKNNIGLAAAAGGAAIAGFALKAISDTQQLSLEVGKFSQKTGVAVDDSSRFVEVASDLGLPVDTLASAIGRVEREAAGGNLAQYGVTAKDGKEQFLQLLDHISKIPDADQRAKVAFQTLGKSWQELAPLLDSTTGLRDRLAEVSGAKIRSAEDVAQAKQFRDDLDRVTDAAQNLELALGSIAIPFIDTVTQILGPLAELTQKLADARKEAQEKASEKGASFWDQVAGFFTQTGPEAVNFWLNKLDEATGGTGDRFGKMGDSAMKLGDVIEGNGQKWLILADRTENVTDKTDDQIKALQQQAIAAGDSGTATQEAADAQKAAQDAIDKVNASLADQANAVKKAYDANFALKDAQDKLFVSLVTLNQTTGDATKSEGEKAKATRDSEQAAEDVAVALAEQTTQQQLANGETVTAADKQANFRDALVKVANTLDANSPLRANIINLADDINNKLPASKQVDIIAATANAQAALQTIINQLQNLPKQVFIDVFGKVHVGGAASGGPHSGVTLVGEEGPELVDLPAGSNVHTAAETRSILSSSANGSPSSLGVSSGDIYNYNVEINVAQKLTPDETINLVEQWRKRNGNRRPWMAA